MRLIHLSDIHVWRWEFNPLLLLGKRSVGMFALLKGRARRFHRERLVDVIEKVKSLDPDHILITGDLTTTSLPQEFADAKRELAPILTDARIVTILPGNHDRYTRYSVRRRLFEATFGEFAPSEFYPWLRWLDDETAILGLDATRSHHSARGLLPPSQLSRAQTLLAEAATRPRRLIVGCHYPLEAPAPLDRELTHKRMVNAGEVATWLETLGPHLYLCGHVHAAWAFAPKHVPQQLCLNSGAPLLRDHTGIRPPGFLEVLLDGSDVTVVHHGWSGTDWITTPMVFTERFFTEP